MSKAHENAYGKVIFTQCAFIPENVALAPKHDTSKMTLKKNILPVAPFVKGGIKRRKRRTK
jgi:hypothetical protein